ncbi:NTP transferase domain-containing protein [Candidatus Woesearchaeota archaeon]|nr:NTP transferase domain-containing protein [Candidatus Woesearchaeota archaeon]
MANVVPLAGLSSRFSKEGYTIPKPLIPVSGMPMIIKAIRSMPPSNKWIFIVRQEHIKQHKIDTVIKEEIPHAIIIAINETTPGQANTCLLAQAYLEPKEPLFIAACDTACTYDSEKYQTLLEDQNIDCIVWTFSQMEKMRISPQSYGWAKLAEDNQTIANMSVKVPISSDPFNDHAVVATFYFKKAQDFIDATNLMIKENHTINNEFYVDAVPIFMNKMNKKSVIFDVDQFICWGTPAELQEYEYWETFFKKNQQFDEKIHNREKYVFWKKYFTKYSTIWER